MSRREACAASTVEVAEDDAAGLGAVEEVQAAQERRLAGAGGPDDGDALADADLEVDAVEHDPLAEPLAQPLDPDHRANARPRRASSRRCTKERASTITQYMQATTRKASR